MMWKTDNDFRKNSQNLYENTRSKIDIVEQKKDKRYGLIKNYIYAVKMIAKCSKLAMFSLDDTYIYKYFVEERVEPSGGESQKLAIARALYKDTPIVVFNGGRIIEDGSHEQLMAIRDGFYANMYNTQAKHYK